MNQQLKIFFDLSQQQTKHYEAILDVEMPRLDVFHGTIASSIFRSLSVILNMNKKSLTVVPLLRTATIKNDPKIYYMKKNK